MGTFAGSEPRLFISFHLENEATGQPAQETDENMDTSSPNSARREGIEGTSSDEIEVIEISLSSPENTDVEPARLLGVSVKTEPESEDAQLVAEIRRSGFTSNGSTGSDETCEAYLAKKLGEMEKSEQPKVTTKSNCEVKQSESEPMVSRPSCSPIGQTHQTQTEHHL